MMRKICMTLVYLLVAGATFAGTPVARRDAAPARMPQSAPTSSVVPVAVQSYADAYNSLAGPSHIAVASSDGNPGPPNGSCQGSAPGCTAANTVGRTAYVGSMCINCPGGPNGDDMVAILAFPADQIGYSTSYALRLNNFQNFTGLAHNLSVRVLRNRGDNGSDFGAEAIFKDIGPLGIPVTGGSYTNFMTVVTEARTERTAPDGYASVPARGAFTSHPFGTGPSDTYDTYDRSLTIPLGDISEDVWIAKSSGASYTTCRHSCTAPLIRNLDCDLPIVNPLYIAITSVTGGNRSSAVAIQEGLAVDNLIHIQGNCDYDGSQFPGDIAGGGAGVELLF